MLKFLGKSFDSYQKNGPVLMESLAPKLRAFFIFYFLLRKQTRISYPY